MAFLSVTRFLRPPAFVLFLVSLPLVGQSGTANQLNSLSPVGVPPGASTAGTNEQIALGTGALNLFIPLLAIPQRGGWTLPLGYTYDSNLYHPILTYRVSASVDNTDSGQNPIPYTNITYNNIWTADRALLEPNLPRLQASIEYDGDYHDINDYQHVAPHVLNFCITNWTFTDWSGTPHQFPGKSSCSDKQQLYTSGTDKVADSSDGSFYQISFASSSEVVVYAKNGTQYHFPGQWDPYYNVPAGQAAGATNNVPEAYDSRGMTMSDPNGNTITVADRSDQTQTSGTAWTITDTVGHTITMGQDGVTYLDANSTSSDDKRIISMSSVSGPPLSSALTYGGSTCAYDGTPPPYGANKATGAAAQTSTGTTLVTLAMPAADSSGTSRKYKLLFDPAGHLLRADYPSGGYTRYDFTNYPQGLYNAGTFCQADMFQVSAKYVCSASSSSCSTEEKTTYNPTVGLASVDSPFNTSIDVASPLVNSQPPDPAGTIETHIFKTQQRQFTSPSETDVITKNTSGQTLRTVHTDYTDGSYPNYPYPSVVTTTLSDSPKSSASVTSYQYKALYPLDGPQGGWTVSLDTPTEIDVQGFGGALLTKSTTNWKSATSFSTPHILDRKDTESLLDGVDGTTKAMTYGYDGLGNLTSVAQSGSDITNTTTLYGPYTNGYPAWFQDARGARTTFDYSNNLSGVCASSLNAGAYLTKTTAPDGAVTSYQYDACTGLLASTTDANLNTTTNHYDALGRRVSSVEPGALSILTSFYDGVPNSSTVTTAASPNPDQIRSQTLDGLGRVASVVNGDVQTDTAYDAAGRIRQVSNPRLVGSGPSGYTITSYDALNRPSRIQHPDGSASTMRYHGEFTVATDEAGVTRVNTSDARGAVTAVCEVAGPLAANNETPSPCPTLPGEAALQGYTTGYSYNGRGDLTQVSARGQTRSFTYDALSRLKLSNNPESGSTCYGYMSNGNCGGGYDANGNLLHKLDARGTGISYVYDALNRLVSKQYDDGTPSACFQYAAGTGAGTQNGNGRLFQNWTQAGACPSGTSGSGLPSGALTWKRAFAYDASGRILREQKCAPGGCVGSAGLVEYTYDLAGAVRTSTSGNPDDITHSLQLTYSNDSAGRLALVGSNVSDATHPAVLFSAGGSSSSSGYGPFGLVAAQYGVNAAANSAAFTQQTAYDNRGRITSTSATPRPTSGGSGSGNPVTLSLSPNPVPAGVQAQWLANCDETCGSGGATLLIDGARVSGFSYIPNNSTTDVLYPPLPQEGSHSIQVVFGGDATHPPQASPIIPFTVAPNNQATMPLSVQVTPNPVPYGESTNVQVTAACAPNCSSAYFTIDDIYYFGLYFDDNGVAGNDTDNSLAPGAHHIKVYYAGNANTNYGYTTTDYTVQQFNLVDPNIVITQSQDKPSYDDQSTSFTVKLACGANCRGGHYFVDGNYAGGYYPDSSGSAEMDVAPGLSRGSHQLTVTYPGDTTYAPTTSTPFSFTTVADTLPKATITMGQLPNPFPAGQIVPISFSVTAPAPTTCGGNGQTFVDGAYSGGFFPDTNGNTGANVNATSAGSGHLLEVRYFGSPTCAPASYSINFASQ